MERIKNSDLIGKGVVGQAEVPGLPPMEMQYKVEEIVRDVAIPKINEVIDEIGKVEEDFEDFSGKMADDMGDFRQKLAGINAEVQNIPNGYVSRTEFSEIEQTVDSFPENYASKEEVQGIIAGGGHPVLSVFGRLGEIKAQAGDYTPEQVGAAPQIHTHSRNEIEDFPDSMPASDVYDWAKESEKPSYTYDEVGAEKSGAAASAVAGHASDSSAHSALFNGKQNKPVSISGSGNVNITLQDNCEYVYTGVGSLSVEGTSGEAHGFVTFGNPLGSINVPSQRTGDDISKAKANETWEFSCFKNRFIWKNWG